MKRLLITSAINSLLAVLLFLFIAGCVSVPFNPSGRVDIPGACKVRF